MFSRRISEIASKNYNLIIKEMSEGHDYLAKVVIIGDSAVGKTNLLMRYINGQEYKTSHIPTIGVDFKTKVLEVCGKRIKLQLWDTAGQQRFRTITETYFNGASGVVVVLHHQQRKSFDNVKEWMEQIQQHNDENIPKVILANKCDLSNTKDKAVSSEEGRLLAEKYSAAFLEVSAKLDINVKEGFYLLAQKIKKTIDYEIDHPQQGRPIKVILAKQKDIKNKNKLDCCK